MAELTSLIVNGPSKFNADAFGVNIYANKHITNGGTSAQFVKGDGTLDSTIYSTSSGAAKTAWGQTYVNAAGVLQTINGNMTNIGDATPSVDNSKKLGSSSLRWLEIWGVKFRTANYEITEYSSRLAFGSASQQTAKGINIGDLLVSSAWSDSSKVPTNGIYSKGQIKSGVATGTAPFIVDSTTKVTNLYSDFADIGKSTPKALTSNGTTATTTAGTVYGVVGNASSGSRVPTKWYVNLDTGDTTLKDGMIITMRMPTAGLGTVGECITIDGNESHFHQVIYCTNSYLTTHFGVNTVLTLQYDANYAIGMYGKYDSSTQKYIHNGNTTTTVTGCWRVLNLYDSGNTDVRYHQTIYYPMKTVASDGAIRRYTLCMQTPTGKITSLCLTDNAQTSTTKTMYSGYLDPRKIYYWNHSDNYAANANITRNNTMLTHNGDLIDYRYTFNCSTTLTGRNNLYIVGTINSNGFKLDPTTPYSSTLPTSDDGKVYIYVGMIYPDSGGYRGTLEEANTIYWYKNGAVRIYVPSSDNSSHIQVTQKTNNTNYPLVFTEDDANNGYKDLYKNHNYIWWNPSKCSFGHGNGVTASGNYSHAEGNHTIASGSQSHAEGYDILSPISYKQSFVVKVLSSSEKETIKNATGFEFDYLYVHDHPSYSFYSANFSGAIYSDSNLSNLCGYVVYEKNYEINSSLHGTFFMLHVNIANKFPNPVTLINGNTYYWVPVMGAKGDNSHKEGKYNLSLLTNTHSEGECTMALGTNSHAEGSCTHTNGLWSHTEGMYTTTFNGGTHAEGNHTIASGNYSHAEGTLTQSNGENSHAEGCNTIASGYASHSEGQSTQASGNFSHAEGYNSPIDPDEDIVTITVNTLTSAQKTQIKNAYGIQFTYIVTGDDIPDDYISQGVIYSDAACTNLVGRISIGKYIYVSNPSLSGDAFNLISGSLTNGGTYYWKRECGAYGMASHIEGYSVTAPGSTSHAEGYSTTASGSTSHAEGYSTTASGNYAHVEGYSSTASGEYSHAEGYSTTASGEYSHAEGNYTIASGMSSHASGYYTHAIHNYEAAFGQYNKSNSNTLFSVGYGTTNSDRKNLFEIRTDSTIHMLNGVFYVNTTGAYHTSDISLKYDIRDILNKDVHDLFNTENGFVRYFKWKENDKPSYGFIAQELEEYCPEAVELSDDNLLHVNYNIAFSKIIGAMFKKIKELENEIKILKGDS